MTTKHTGGCACGAIRYQSQSAPINPHYCHCGMCQRSVGAPVLAWVNFAEDGFTWASDEPTYYESSSVMQRGFCAQCGTSICTREDDGYVCVTIASLDDAASMQPRYHIYAQHGLPWLDIHDDLPREKREDRA